MILAIKDAQDKEHGTDLPMFSRVGKTTVSMYIAFSQAAQHKKEEEKNAEMGIVVSEQDKKKKRVSKYEFQ